MTNQTMRHMWCEKPGEIELRQRPIFEVGDNEVLVKIAYTGICPWDVRAFSGKSSVAFPRVLGRYSRDLGLFSLEEAVRRMTSFPAERTGLPERGRIAAGLPADPEGSDAEAVLTPSLVGAFGHVELHDVVVDAVVGEELQAGVAEDVIDDAEAGAEFVLELEFDGPDIGKLRIVVERGNILAFRPDAELEGQLVADRPAVLEIEGPLVAVDLPQVAVLCLSARRPAAMIDRYHTIHRLRPPRHDWNDVLTSLS